MKTLTTKGGQIFEIFENLSEAKRTINDDYLNNMDYISEDDTLFIKYKDGSIFSIFDVVEGTYKKTGIETVILSNGSTTQIYGNYRIYNMDDTDIEYSKENDTEDTLWNVDER